MQIFKQKKNLLKSPGGHTLSVIRHPQEDILHNAH